jgi:hypothetical protein
MGVMLVAALAVDVTHRFQAKVWLGLGLALVFVGFELAHNLPMYLRRMRTARVDVLSFREGLRDMHERRAVSFAWGDWSGDAAWLTPYFTVGVWLSQALALL